MKQIINWEPETDQYTKSGEIEVHNQVYGEMYKHNKYENKEHRINVIKDCEKTVKQKINGNVLDIGCGNGYASVFIAKHREAIVHSMECNIAAVDKLARKHYQSNQIPEDKYELILGSFNKIPNKNYYDYVVSLGVLHHSSNLLVTMKELYSCLKPSGYLFAHEPLTGSMTPNSVFINKNKQTKNVQNLVQWKESDRDDHFFRECEWLTAFHHSGFNVIKYARQKNNNKLDNALIVLQKPETDHTIPHRWI